MPSLILLRHGESVGNADNAFTGQLDVYLSEKGIKQAQHAAELLKDYRFGLLMTSQLRRAWETADIIMQKTGQPYIYSRITALNEKHFGDFQGKSFSEVHSYKNEPWFNNHDLALPGGESTADVEQRVLPYYHGLAKWRLSQNENVLIVAHQHSLLAIIREIEQKRDYAYLENAIPRVYELDEGLAVLVVKDLD